MAAHEETDAKTGRTRSSAKSGAGGAAGQLVLWPGIDPAMRDLIERVNAPDYRAREAQLRRVGGCAHPLHVRGATRGVDWATGRVDWEYSSREAPGGVVLIRCGNRRAAVCPSCSRLYQGDTFQLVRAGLAGGKGIPASVAQHPRVFATLTAPGFGAVHTYRPPNPNSSHSGNWRGVCEPRRTPPCQHARATACWSRHDENDRRLGAPLCVECYDYRGAVVWQASVGKLWSRFRTYLPRHLATVAGRSRAEAQATVRLSFVKIVEYQKRGLVHLHAVIRADGIHDDPPTGPATSEGGSGVAVPPPSWVTAKLLSAAVLSAADAATVRVNGGDAGSWLLRWGVQRDVQPIHPGLAPSVEGNPADWVASYVAKYATKGTESTGWDSRAARTDPPEVAGPQATHAVRMVTTAIDLSETPELAHLRLGRWAKELAYRGHVSSKSRRYSTTLGALREARANHGRSRRESQRSTNQTGAAGLSADAREADEAIRVESSWRVVGHGLSPGAAILARQIARDTQTNTLAARQANDDERVNGHGDW